MKVYARVVMMNHRQLILGEEIIKSHKNELGFLTINAIAATIEIVRQLEGLYIRKMQLPACSTF